MNETTPSPAVARLNRGVQGAHDTVDQIAEKARPAAQQLGENISAAQDALEAKTDQLRTTTDEWVDGVRTSVRRNPLVYIAAAAALGAVIARITR